MERNEFVALLEKMLTIRLFEMRVVDVFSQAKTPGGGHVYVG